MRKALIIAALLLSCSQFPNVKEGLSFFNRIPAPISQSYLPAIQDFSYALRYLSWIEATGNQKAQKPAIDLMRKLARLLKDRPQYAPGYPRYNSNRDLLEKYDFPLLPGVDQSTWCNMYVFDAVELFYPGRGRALCEWRGIWFTDSDEMSALCEKRLRQITQKKAIILANTGKLVIVSSKGIGKNKAHFAVLLPTIQGEPLRVAQAGSVNGFIRFDYAFALGAGIVEAPRYYEIF